MRKIVCVVGSKKPCRYCTLFHTQYISISVISTFSLGMTVCRYICAGCHHKLQRLLCKRQSILAYILTQQRCSYLYHMDSGFYPGLMSAQADAEGSNTGRSRSRSKETKISTQTIRQPPQTAPQIPHLREPYPEFYAPRMNDDGTPGYNPERYNMPESSEIGIAWGSPPKDNTTPAVTKNVQVPISQDYSPSGRGLNSITPAMQAAIDRAVRIAVKEAMKSIQEDTIKIMQDFTKKKAMMEHEQAAEFKKWFDARLTDMNRRIQRSDGIADDADGDQVDKGARSRDENEVSSMARAEDTSIPVQSGSPAPGGRTVSDSQTKNLVSCVRLYGYFSDLIALVEEESIYILQRDTTR